MDASDEFRYIAPSKDKQDKRRSEPEPASTSSDDRNVPVCVTNSNKNVKLRFMWDKAFKLFHSHRTVYKAISGINYQDYRTGGNSLPVPGMGPGLGYTSRSFSYNHLNRLSSGDGMGLPGGSETAAHLRSYKKHNRSEEQVSVIVPKSKPKRSCIVGRSGSCACGETTCSGGPSERSCNKKNNNTRPVSISGGEKPEGEHDDEEDKRRRRRVRSLLGNSTGNIGTEEGEEIAVAAAAAAAVQLRRSHSTNSAGCHSSRSDGQSRNSYHFYDDINNPYCYPCSSYGSGETSPYPEKSVSKVEISGGHSSYGEKSEYSEDLYGHDSGLDTWKTPTEPRQHREDKSGPRSHAAIVCTISNKIPSETSEDPTKDENGMEESSTMDRQCLNGPNTTVVLISERNPLDSPSTVKSEPHNHHHHEVPTAGFFSDYECMSEIDLNSDSGSTEEDGTSADSSGGQQRGISSDKMRFISGLQHHGLLVNRISSHDPRHQQQRHQHRPNNLQQLLENELDSLDLTLFETAGGRTVTEKERTFLQAVRELDDDCVDFDDDEPLYDTVTGSDPSCSSCNTSTNYRENMYWNWSDAGSEFEFMTPANILNRDIPLGHSPRGQHPEIEWEPYFCVLNQLDQTFTAYRSEEMSLSENGISPTEVPRVRLDGGPNSVKCLINNSKWGMNPVMEEEEEASPSTQQAGGKTPAGTTDKKSNASENGSSNNSGSNQLRNSTPVSPLGPRTPETDEVQRLLFFQPAHLPMSYTPAVVASYLYSPEEELISAFRMLPEEVSGLQLFIASITQAQTLCRYITHVSNLDSVTSLTLIYQSICAESVEVNNFRQPTGQLEELTCKTVSDIFIYGVMRSLLQFNSRLRHVEIGGRRDYVMNLLQNPRARVHLTSICLQLQHLEDDISIFGMLQFPNFQLTKLELTVTRLTNPAALRQVIQQQFPNATNALYRRGHPGWPTCLQQTLPDEPTTGRHALSQRRRHFQPDMHSANVRCDPRVEPKCNHPYEKTVADLFIASSNGAPSLKNCRHTSYDKACGSEQRRSSAPLTPLLGGRETPSRFANFFSKRSFKSNPLKRTKSVTKLERKKPTGNEPESNILYPSRLRTSRSHESLLAWTNNPHALNNFVNNGMMSTVDLTAGDVLIRTLHPSILGQDFAFQVITPSGSKYYSCSSGPERDAWVHALRQAIKPHSDEIRRQESSLKLWILEAKGVAGGSGKHSKRYFCELYLDDVLYARTCAKPKGEMLFWGEHFEFSQLPNCVQLITVVFFREGDKKRKKERNTCIGKVKIPVSTVNSRSLIEKWYPVVPDSGSNQTLNSKEKDGPSLRVKCKFQSVDILPLRCYRAFLQYVKDEYGPVSESLETVLSVKAKEDLASAMVHVLHHEGLAKEFIAELALQEILKSGDEKLTFRGNSIATKAMEAFLKLTGTEYLHATLGSFIEQFQNAEDVDCEIDPMKLPSASSNTLNKNQQNLRMAIETVWKSILHSHSMFPLELRECFAHCREALKSAGKEDLSDHLISASIFLRFLCPAILSPSLFNITNEYPTEKSARNLTLVAKILQTLANFTRFQGKENYMEFVNDFVEREAPNMKLFLARISSPLSAEAVKKLQKENRDKVPAGGFIDLGKYLSILSTLLSESVAKIAPKNDRFKQLQEILESIHLWLKQPANATNVSMFPFPHLTSPPPTVPPPPAPIGIHLNHPHHHQRAAVNHQYQVPHQNSSSNNNNNNNNNNPSAPQPIYAVTNVIHNNCNPNVKNISEVHIPPLQLQIPPVTGVLGSSIMNNNPRSGSQASSGYQSQSPVLEGCEDKSKKSHQVNNNNGAEFKNDNSSQYRKDATGGEVNQVSFNRSSFSNNRKSGSQSVDDLSSVGVEPGEALAYKKRLTRSSSSSDCEYTPSSVHSKGKSRSSQKNFSHHNNALVSSGQAVKPKQKMVPTPHHRLSRRSSAELLRKNHPYSSSTEDDSDSGHNNVSERDESLLVPQLPPRRAHGNSKRNSVNVRPNPDGSLSSNGDKSLEEYEREMLELRRAMEALQVKLNRAEERLFGGHDTSSNGGGGGGRRESDIFIPSAPSPSGGSHSGGSGSGTRERLSVKSADENSMEMDQLLQRLLSAEEEMKREQELLSALDRKQKLIDAQEQKIARLDAVNNQLLEALAQIRDSLQQQHVLAQQQKIQMQLQKQQQHLQSLSNGVHPLPASPTNRNFGSNNHKLQSSHYSLHCNNNNNNNNSLLSNGCVNKNNNGSSYLSESALHPAAQPQVTPRQNNTTKVLITSDSSGDSGSVSPIMSLEINSQDCSNGNNPRDSATFLGEQALKMLAELKSSSC